MREGRPSSADLVITGRCNVDRMVDTESIGCIGNTASTGKFEDVGEIVVCSMLVRGSVV